MKITTICFALLSTLTVSAALHAAEPITFPADSGVVDVTAYGATPNDASDDTASIQKAFDENTGNGSVIYLPPGTYLISNTIRWPGRASYNILQGAGQEHTVLRLMDKTPAFGNADKPKDMIYTGGPPAQRFRNAVRDLTIDCGNDNPGAVGLSFCANNQGGVFDVTIRSGVDGKQPGAHGLALDEPEVGPLLVKNVTVIGFDLGIRVRHSVNSVTLENITLRGQRKAGIDNYNNYVFARKVVSDNVVPAVVNDGPEGVVTLIDSTLRGGEGAGEVAAIRNANDRATLYVRNVEVTGYGKAIQDAQAPSVAAGKVDEWVSDVRAGLFAGPLRSMNLAIVETPVVPHDPLDQWVSPAKFGGLPGDGKDDTEAIQKAIDSGATTVYLPRGKQSGNLNDPGRMGSYFVSDTIHIRGNVRRIVGLEAMLDVVGDLEKNKEKPVFVFEDGTQPAVVVERLRFSFSKFDNPAFAHRSKRDLVISSFSGTQNLRHESAGRLFLDDVVGPNLYLGKGATLYARQLNIEGAGLKFINDGGTMWVLGLKTECAGPIGLTKNGGRTEIIGGHLYKCVRQAVDETLFVVEDAQMTLAGVAEYCWDHQFASGGILLGSPVRHSQPGEGNAGARDADVWR